MTFTAPARTRVTIARPSDRPPRRACYTRWPSSERRIERCSVQRDVQAPLSWQYQRTSAQAAPPSATMSDVSWRVPHSQHHALPPAASSGLSSGPPGVLTSVSLIAVIVAVCS